jgi:hypothetical protein
LASLRWIRYLSRYLKRLVLPDKLLEPVKIQDLFEPTFEMIAAAEDESSIPSASQQFETK